MITETFEIDRHFPLIQLRRLVPTSEVSVLDFIVTFPVMAVHFRSFVMFRVVLRANRKYAEQANIESQTEQEGTF